MGVIEAYVARKAEMHGDGDSVAYAPGAEVVDLAYFRFLFGDPDYFFFNLVGKAAFGKFVDGLFHEFQSGRDDEEADNDSGDGVEYGPSVS